mgnify:CR=1 FL=1
MKVAGQLKWIQWLVHPIKNNMEVNNEREDKVSRVMPGQTVTLESVILMEATQTLLVIYVIAGGGVENR